MGDELERLRAEYARRALDPDVARRDDYADPAHRYLLETRERDLVALLRRRGISLRHVRVLDVGCGSGEWLRGLLADGAEPGALHGIDLLPERIERARRLSPGVDFRCGSADRLPHPAAAFDVVAQFTVFSSILDPDLRVRVAREMWRVLKPGGVIVWYDFWINPTNPATRGVGRGEVRRLFPEGGCTFRRATLAPPLARLVVPRLSGAAALLEALPFLRSHYLALIAKVPQ